MGESFCFDISSDFTVVFKSCSRTIKMYGSHEKARRIMQKHATEIIGLLANSHQLESVNNIFPITQSKGMINTKNN